MGAPAGAGLLKQIQLYHLAAAARANHRSCPEVIPLARKIDRRLRKLVRKFIHPDAAKEFGFSPKGKEAPRYKSDDGP